MRIGEGGLIRHATLVAWLDRGVLIEGPSGSGKSDLALRLIEAGGMLVADDLVRLFHHAGRTYGTVVGRSGLIELRGHGIYRLPTIEAVGVDLLVDLVEESALARLPEPAALTLLGRTLPRIALDPRPASAVARLRVILTCERIA